MQPGQENKETLFFLQLLPVIYREHEGKALQLILSGHAADSWCPTSDTPE